MALLVTIPMLTMPDFSPECTKNSQSMNVLVTGCQGIGQAICEKWSGHNVTCVSRSTGHDINCWSQWIADFYEFDVFVNNAQSAWHQTELLVHMANRWRDQPGRIIINIGSTVASYSKSHGDDKEFSQYRNQKRTLQDAFHQLAQQCQCRLILINPGPTDTDLMQGVAVDKMSADSVAKYVQLAVDHPEIKRLDIWQ
jgi:NAD(P)-dependent dehydrogenase (short-subunit alcohol dehydrogenase family)